MQVHFLNKKGEEKGEGMKTWYGVWVGKNPGVYETWSECQEQTKGISGAKFRKIKANSRKEAEKQWEKGYENTDDSSPTIDETLNIPYIDSSICVDGACRIHQKEVTKVWEMEYRGVHPITKQELFRSPVYKAGTNVIAEFLAIVEAMRYILSRNDKQTVIYSDSEAAIVWVRNKKHKSTLERNLDTEQTWLHLEQAVMWLKEQTDLPTVLKWNTSLWGENPADFGRK